MMSPMVRKQIYLSQSQDALLKLRAHETGVTEAELVREALEAHLRYRPVPQRSLAGWEKQREFIRSLMDAGPVPGGRTWKREDLYDR